MSGMQRLLLAVGMAFAWPTLSIAAELPAATPVAVRGRTPFPQSASVPATEASALSGTWQSEPDETPLSSAFDESVWGKHAVAIRSVQMTVGPTGDGTLTVSRNVVDGRRHTVPGSPSVERVHLSLGTVQKSTDIRCDLTVFVKQAERHYPDDPGFTWPIEGLRVGVTTFPGDPEKLEIRVDTPEGRGSFWETLRRAVNKKPSTTH